MLGDSSQQHSSRHLMTTRDVSLTQLCMWHYVYTSTCPTTSAVWERIIEIGEPHMQPAWTLPKKMCKRRADALTLASLDKYKENDWLWQVCASARNAAMKNVFLKKVSSWSPCKECADALILVSLNFQLGKQWEFKTCASARRLRDAAAAPTRAF